MERVEKSKDFILLTECRDCAYRFSKSYLDVFQDPLLIKTTSGICSVTILLKAFFNCG